MIRIATAGWSIPRHVRDAFPAAGTTLARYARVLNSVEINSSFYRPHQAKTYAAWAASTPKRFRFAVKMPQSISHERALVGCARLVDVFLDQVSGLGDRLGCLLLQLPPSVVFRNAVAARFFALLRRRHAGGVALEPRHRSWFEPRVDALLRDHAIARVAADPPRAVVDAGPGGAPELVYYRLHGSPRIYWSPYDAEYLVRLAKALRRAHRSGADVWCIFDNTASGAAAANALELRRLLQAGRLPRSVRVLEVT